VLNFELPNASEASLSSIHGTFNRLSPILNKERSRLRTVPKKKSEQEENRSNYVFSAKLNAFRRRNDEKNQVCDVVAGAG
jgi:hypothetical protein